MSLRRKILYGFTAMVIVALLLLPATGWLARLQLLPFFSGGTVGTSYLAASTGNDQKAIDTLKRQVAESRPADFDLQYAYALEADRDESLRRLDALSQRFPNDPRVISAQLREWTRGDGSDAVDNRVLHISRPEDENRLLPPDKTMTIGSSVHAYVPDPAMLTQVDALCGQGELAEPSNGFFPMMRAIADFAAHRDADGIAAWKHAGDDAAWNDYTLTEMQARTHLLLAMHGGNEVGAFARMADSASIVLPQYAVFRSGARMATVLAVQAELAGNTEEGFGIRRATRRIGEAMQTTSPTYIGNMVGIAIVAIPSSRPGGAPAMEIRPPAQANGSVSQEERDRPYRVRYDAYSAYLNRIGHSEEAVAFTAAHANSLRLKDIGSAGMQASYFGFSDKTGRLIACWATELLLVTGTLFALAFGGIFGLVYRFSPRIQKGEPLQTSARWGVTAGLLIPFVGIPLAMVADHSSEIAALGIIAASVTVLVGSTVLLRLTMRQIGHGILVLLGTWASLAALAAAGGLAAMLFLGPCGVLTLCTSMMTGGADGGQTSLAGMPWAVALPMLVGGALMLLPVAMLLAFSLFSRILGVPVAAGVTRGMRSLSVPLACVLLLGWSVCLVATLRHENAAIHELDRVTQKGELQTYAELTGMPLPVTTGR